MGNDISDFPIRVLDSSKRLAMESWREILVSETEFSI